jgi:nucleoside 2-deoxyribosyltransferase
MNLPKDVKRIYLASPYSHPDPNIMKLRVDFAAQAAAYLLVTTNAVVYSPIVHSHYVAEYLDNHLDHTFWLAQDRSHIATCDELVVYQLNGWDKSIGVSWEIGLANGLGIWVSYLEVDKVIEWLKREGEE